MIALTTPRQTKRRCGRGPGSKRGKTCGRGHKGSKARSGYRRRYGHEGGQLPLYRRLPKRGGKKSRATPSISINFRLLQRLFTDGESVTLRSLQQKRHIGRGFRGKLKIIAGGKLEKKLSIVADAFSKGARAHLEAQRIGFQQHGS